MYEPRTSRELLRSMVARVQARTPLTDFTEGSVGLLFLAAISEEIAGAEMRLGRIRDSFFLDNAVGSDLDARISEFPGDMARRLPAVSASGDVLEVTRTSSAEVQVLPAGSLFGRSDDPSVFYQTTADVTFAVGVSSMRSIGVACLLSGESGNVESGGINRIVQAPSWVVRGVSSKPLKNGSPEETDEQLRARARLFLSSLARCQPSALEYAGRSFASSQGARFSFVRLFEDPATPGYSDLVGDDGAGLQGSTREGAPSAGTIMAGGIGLLWHEAPATGPITTVSITRGNATFNVPPDKFVSLPERGLVYVDADQIQVWDTWSITGFSVYTGIVAELQAELEGSSEGSLGHRAAGTRVRVVPPEVQRASFDVHVVPRDGVALVSLQESVRDAIVSFISTLGPGDPLYTAQLIDQIMNDSRVLNVKLYGRGQATPLSDIYPSTNKRVLRAVGSEIYVVPSLET